MTKKVIIRRKALISVKVAEFAVKAWCSAKKFSCSSWIEGKDSTGSSSVSIGIKSLFIDFVVMGLRDFVVTVVEFNGIELFFMSDDVTFVEIVMLCTELNVAMFKDWVVVVKVWLIAATMVAFWFTVVEFWFTVVAFWFTVVALVSDFDVGVVSFKISKKFFVVALFDSLLLLNHFPSSSNFISSCSINISRSFKNFSSSFKSFLVMNFSSFFGLNISLGSFLKADVGSLHSSVEQQL